MCELDLMQHMDFESWILRSFEIFLESIDKYASQKSSTLKIMAFILLIITTILTTVIMTSAIYCTMIIFAGFDYKEENFICLPPFFIYSLY